MPDLGIGEIMIVALVVFALFGYKRLPDAARSLGRSMRVFKAEVGGLKQDDVRAKAEAPSAHGPLGEPTRQDSVTPDPAERPTEAAG
jgi:sec-independent protein translocase protein TatA